MGIVNAVQMGQDGIGKEVKISANSITMKAKKVTIERESTLRITGLTTGTTHAVQVVVRPGSKSLGYVPPPVNPNPPSGPIANFNYSVGSGNNNNSNFNQQNPGFNAGSGPPNLDF
jgi:hypothetical protein